METDEKFQIVFLSTVALTALCGLALGAIAIWGPNPPTPPIAALIETLKLGFSGGMFTIFGLLGATKNRRRPRRLRSRQAKSRARQ